MFISGGSAGIGFAIARQAAIDGARVSILARDASKLEAAREEIRRTTGAEVAIYSADIRDEAAVNKAIAAAGTIDLLVSNLGVGIGKEFEDTTMEEIRFQVDVNIMGTLYLLKAALPRMKKASAEDGLPRSISFTTSMGGQTGVYGYAVYCATNYAVRGLAEALQMELHGENIHLSLILPGDTDTATGNKDRTTRPELTNLISGTSAMQTAEEVATLAIKGIRAADFNVCVNSQGLMLALATAGFSPQRSFLMAFLEVFGGGLMRFAGLCYLSSWYKTIEEYKGKTRKARK
ncbi:unnamed protein product [Spirodela intermedia]|uniref:3-dehydrosphinganine reductase n=1 Tax=Spirodela intermedia TaxID=51605 RepID=A0ABN7E9M9_SPIIN|nr:unnamed protein product [Spirodela intermedia]CAA6674090.1 unnamed protein product [Spirodela intermedia]CAA6674410.1 unnamed protein product [Spirodela intermedia]